jgi:predicted RNase H-like HicB family nuclease
MELKYTYWQTPDGWFLGYLDDYPLNGTQGKTVAELEEMLADLYNELKDETPPVTAEKKTGVLMASA